VLKSPAIAPCWIFVSAKERKYRDDDHARKAADEREGVGRNVTCQNRPRHKNRGDLDGRDRPGGRCGAR